MQVHNETNQVSYATLNKAKQQSEGIKVEENPQKTEQVQGKKVEVPKSTNGEDIKAHKQTVKTQKTDKVEISSQAMTLFDESVKLKNSQATVTKESSSPEQVESNVQNIVASMTASMTASQTVSITKTDAHATSQKVKESIKDTDVKKLSSALDSRRQNVSTLLK